MRDHLYSNKAGTGKFVWKKDILVDKTFSQVLDKMVEEFPDQLAFKYTTMDYTRTYSEFRDDVDTFARALVSLGVKPAIMLLFGQQSSSVVYCFLGNYQNRCRTGHCQYRLQDS